MKDTDDSAEAIGANLPYSLNSSHPVADLEEVSGFPWNPPFGWT